jgi:hypothetical protein
MINIQVNKSVIANLEPCQDRLDNYLAHYSNFNGSILEFLDLEHISSTDKIWVAVRLLPREQLEYFAIDCAFAATAYMMPADTHLYAVATVTRRAAYETVCYAVYNASTAASNASYSSGADYGAERQNQVEVLKYLIENA